MFLTAMFLSIALCTQAFGGDSAPPCPGRKIHLREWAKAVFTVQCKTCIFCKNPPAPEPAAADAPKETPNEAPKTDAAPPPPAPPSNKASM